MAKIISNSSVSYSDIPVLETSRLRLRAHTIDDLEPLTQIWGQSATTRFIGRTTRSRSDLWQQIQRAIGCWALLGFGYWVIEALDTGDCIGELGFMEGLRNIEPNYTGTPEAGWVISPSFWGTGYASEALEAAFAWRDQNVGTNRTVCIIEPEHAVSIHIATKFGFEKISDTQLGGEPIGIYERLT
ncbi:MAG: GNAT family N-acetyltransferase [Hyphomonadaceae bacterium]